MTSSRWLLSLFALALLCACGREAVQPSAALKAVSPDFGRLLPAFPLAHELRTAGKADTAGDYRAAHPTWYEPTVPPLGSFRAMREWEPMSTMLISYTTSLIGSTGVADTVVFTIKAGYQQAPITVLVDSAAARDDLVPRLIAAGVPQSEIGAGKAVRFEQMPLDAFWTIDFAPLPLVRDTNTVAFLDWRYYWGRYLDDAVPSELGERWGATVYRMPANYEGGNFQADGLGTCYTTERGLQNAGVGEAELRAMYAAYAGCTQLVVLKDIAADGTGHVDMFFKLVAPARSILGSFTDAQDPQARADMDDNDTLLRGLSLPDGATMTVLRMPHPNAYDAGWGAIPRTYLNSTLYNGLNLWPVYTVDHDLQADAATVWAEAMPGWAHVGIPSDEISTLSGAIHCITRTLPDFPLARWVEGGSCDGTTGACLAPTGGYSGPCSSDDDCFGPEWLCAQTGSCGVVVDACQGLTYEGCCDGATVRWCENGVLQSTDCAIASPATPKCGWSTSAGYYWCGTEVTTDPTGTFPWACDGGCVPTCEGKTCDQDDGCGHACGCAAGFLCQAGACEACVPDCTDKACGVDGCGGVCGTCGLDEACTDGQCVNQCGGLTYEGCCDGAKVSWCEAGGVQTMDCATLGSTTQKCGWSVSSGFYWCGAEVTPEPTGTFPWACEGGCVPDCQAKTCDQDDGCGQACGCAAGFLCQAGACEACVPDCTDKTCGDNGCGGVCGTCGTNLTCVAGACVDACDGVTYEGCCDGATVRWCQSGALQQVDCTVSPLGTGALCGWDAVNGYYWCDAVGAADPSGQFPLACAISCVPACDGKNCGDDGCGGSCGSCADGQACVAGVCDACNGLTYEGCCDHDVVRWCEGGRVVEIACGPNSIGPVCTWKEASGFYWCGDTAQADPTGVFPPACQGCEPDCADKLCGSDGCFGSCGECAADQICRDGACEFCTPACDGKVCGDDGCLGSCGGCGQGLVCQEGQCVDPCDGITYEGCCDGATVKWCAGSSVSSIDCSTLAGDSTSRCGWNETSGYYWCVATNAVDPSGVFPWACVGGCVPDCVDKACDLDDGCGRPCGCEPGSTCEGGACVACLPDCDGKACGSDGCGGTCGTCGADAACTDGQCVNRCGGLTYEGCCDGAVVHWCDTTGEQTLDCAASSLGGTQCGWSATSGYYWCGDTQDADPSGTFPRVCTPPCVPACGDAECGDDGCGGSCGACAEHHACASGACAYEPWCGDGSCVADEGCDSCPADCACACGSTCLVGVCVGSACDGKVCGDDGCGGSCGACPSGSSCADGACTPDAACGDGACDPGETCSTCWLDCACGCGEECAAGVCAWKACDDKICGSDGCGGSCGACDAHHVCEFGKCQFVPWCGDGACDPSEDCADCPADCACGCGEACAGATCAFTACDGKVCGGDGCGGSCGSCDEHYACDAGACVYVPWCGDGACDPNETCATCAADCGCGCGHACDHGACTFTACDGKSCGSDGCGGSCGVCPDHHACQKGACAYVPWCGDGSCDAPEDCGTCPDDCGCGCGEACVAGAPGLRGPGGSGCVFTACDGKACGDDGCGDSCGKCPAHHACQKGACAYVPWCGDGTCDPDETCASCAADCGCACGQDCAAGACVFTACDTRECGDDGCGGSCGSCQEHTACNDGACAYVPWCGDGACDPDENCASCPADCACGCGEACDAGVCAFTACQDKVCGDDGCGGSCGDCAEHQACEAGACVAVPWCGDGACDAGETCESCVADCACGCGEACEGGACTFVACEDLACGDDGCGGSCGSCGLHDECLVGACVAVPWCGDDACNGDETCSSCPGDCACGCGDACQEGACVSIACADKACGDDGCGGSCGTCDVHAICEDGACVAVPWCGDGACNDGEACDTCEADCGCGCGQACAAGACAFVACDGRACGDDGCGGSCGACGEHEACDEGLCVTMPWCGDATCDLDEDCGSCAIDCACECGQTCEGGVCAVTACDGLECGDDGCGGSCGSCGCGEGCVEGLCAFQACDARSCGDDGCGGSCGSCGLHQICDDGACVDQPWCGDTACDLDESCDSCPADCGCDDDHVCVGGACQPRPCDPACGDHECGPDGCGGSCGECPKGLPCTPDGRCTTDDADVAPFGDIASDDGVGPDASVADEGWRDGGGSSCTVSRTRSDAAALLLLLSGLALVWSLRRLRGRLA